MMLGHRDGVIPQRISQDRLVQHVLVDPVAAVGLVGVVGRQLDTKFHGASLDDSGRFGKG